MYKNSRIVVFMLALLLTLMLVACGGGTESATAVPPTTAPLSTQAPEATDVPPATAIPATAVPTLAPTTEPTVLPATAVPPVTTTDAKEAVLAAMALMIARPFQSDSTLTSSSFSIHVWGQFTPPDSMQITSEIDGRPSNEMIVIGDNGWQKTGDGPWAVMDATTIGLVKESGGLIPNLELLAQSIVEAELVGPDTLEDGTAVLVYKISTTVPNDSGEIVTATIWIDAATGLPAKQEVTTATTSTVQSVSYADDVEIVAPLP